MTKKYDFTGETKTEFGITLKRIRRISDGLIGGWIEKEENLSQEGTCFVFGSARVFDSARVSDSANVFGSASVSGSAKVKTPIINIIGLPYPVTIMDNDMSIGCLQKTHAEWKALTEQDAEKLDEKGKEFYRYFKHTLLSLIEYHIRKE